MTKNRTDTTTLDGNYAEAVAVIKLTLLRGQYEAAKAVNRVQLSLYYAIGRYLSQYTRKGAWGNGVLEAMSQQLRRELPGLRGFSATNLREMRLFYEAWKSLDSNSSVTTDELEAKDILPQAQGLTLGAGEGGFPVEDFFRVPFSHHVDLLANVKDLQARYYYLHRIAEEHLSVAALKRLVSEQAFEKQGNMPSIFSQTITPDVVARKAVMMFKDAYLLDFINVEEIGERDRMDVDERVIEQEIVHNIKDFIMTFGNDFAFIGNQFHLEIYGVEHFPDLLFFNRELNAMVVIELKTGEFKSAYLGQLMTYLSILDAKVKKEHENPSIGIVLCKSVNREYVEFVIRDYNRPLGVATYTTADELPEHLRKALPSIEDLKKLL